MLENSRPLLIGITGNIGSGKSSFCAYLEALGYRLLYADRLAQSHLYDLKDLWVQRWGKRILEGDQLNRAAIAEIVFDNPDERQWLNSQLHPLVLQDFQHEVEHSKEQYLFFEIPLLFEAGLEQCFDYLVLVCATQEAVLQRIMERDKSSEADILKRLRTQMPDSEKAARVDLIIDNSFSVDELYRHARYLAAKITGIPHRVVSPFNA